MSRSASLERKTKETEVSVRVNLDGQGTGRISTNVPFIDHMLNLFSRHGFIDLDIVSQGDTFIDDHHLVEDIGITLGQAIGKALGDKSGIERYGFAYAPMDESLCLVALDISGRPYLLYQVEFPETWIGSFDASLLREFFKSFSDHSGITLHINLLYGTNSHHIAESIFKAWARALRSAVAINTRIKGVLSTKGSL